MSRFGTLLAILLVVAGCGESLYGPKQIDIPGSAPIPPEPETPSITASSGGSQSGTDPTALEPDAGADNLGGSGGSGGSSSSGGTAGVTGGGGNSAAGAPNTTFCDPATTQCNGSAFETCRQDGSEWIPTETCPFACDDEFGCIGECVPEDARCTLNLGEHEICDAFGQWSTESCPFGCENGACTGVCVPGTNACLQIPDLTMTLITALCDGQGSFVQTDICDFVCKEESGVAYCTGECVPGTKRCAGGPAVELCDSDGEWIPDADCEFACEGDGVCAGTCEPGTMRCSGLGIESCDTQGAWQPATTTCPYACLNGACTGNCVPGTLRCNGSATETCDTLGEWGSTVSCPVDPNTAPICSGAGICGTACTSGFADCTAAPGCETTLGSSTNCAACDDACTATPENADPICVGAVEGCGFTCIQGFADCTADPGCETNTQNDETNCGVCGLACNGGQCFNGACEYPGIEPIAVHPGGNSSGWGDRIAQDADNLYTFEYDYTENQVTVRKMPKNGSVSEVITSFEYSPQAEISIGVADMLSAGQHLYIIKQTYVAFVGITSSEIIRCPTTTPNPLDCTQVYSGTGSSHQRLVKNSTHVYWHNEDQEGPCLVNGNGCDPTGYPFRSVTFYRTLIDSASPSNELVYSLSGTWFVEPKIVVDDDFIYYWHVERGTVALNQYVYQAYLTKHSLAEPTTAPENDIGLAAFATYINENGFLVEGRPLHYPVDLIKMESGQIIATSDNKYFIFGAYPEDTTAELLHVVQSVQSIVPTDEYLFNKDDRIYTPTQWLDVRNFTRGYWTTYPHQAYAIMSDVADDDYVYFLSWGYWNEYQYQIDGPDVVTPQTLYRAPVTTYQVF